jgi:hypothetical protein
MVRLRVVLSDSGAEGYVDAARNDLVAELKAKVVDVWPLLTGQLLSLTHRGREMADEASLGDYSVRALSDIKLLVSIAPRQPYSAVDYRRLGAQLAAEGRKRSASSFYVPGEWEGAWEGGEEYLQYPPVLSSNPFSAVPPSSSRELTYSPGTRTAAAASAAAAAAAAAAAQASVTGAGSLGVQSQIPERVQAKRMERARRSSLAAESAASILQDEREREFRSARQRTMGGAGNSSSFVNDEDAAAAAAAASAAAAAAESGPARPRGIGIVSPELDGAARAVPPQGRLLLSVYTCQISSARFQIMHCTEGKWKGTATFLDAAFVQPPGGLHVCSSRTVFVAGRQSAWNEHQLITSPSGVSTKHQFRYLPVADGLLRVETDEPFLRGATIAVREVGTRVIVLTATSLSGAPLLTETITYSTDFTHRVRAVQRFAGSGHFVASYICNESRYIDEESGALEPVA